MKKQTLPLFILLFSLLCGLCACGGTAGPAESGTAAQTEILPPKAEPVRVPVSSLGLTPYCVTSEKQTVAGAVRDGEDIVLTPLCAGTDTVLVYNEYSERAELGVAVDENLVLTYALKAFTPPAQTRRISAAEWNGKDITVPVQEAVDAVAAAGGGTVYVPAGEYLIGTVSMKDHVALRMEGFPQVISDGYGDAVKALIADGKTAVLRTNGKSRSSFFYVNVDLPQAYCTAGHSDFTITGGVYDCADTIKFIGFSCADGATFENTVILDNPNNHAFQIEGSRNVLVRRILFAGYNFPANGVTTRETIQVEPTTPGAIGSNYDTNVIQCKDGDYHQNFGVRIVGCYFGKSDRRGSHLTPLGHHSATGDCICDDLEFSYNTVDNPLYCGVHLANVSGLKILGNHFISLGKATESSIGTDAALVSLYCFDKTLSYTDAQGRKVTYRTSGEMTGVHDVVIADNRFELGGGTFLAAIRAEGLNSTDGNCARYVRSKTLRVGDYGSEPYTEDGFQVLTNTLYNVRITDNRFHYASAPLSPRYFLYLKNIRGLEFAQNTPVLASGVCFTEETDGFPGLFKEVCVGSDALPTAKVTLSATAGKQLAVDTGKETVLFPNPASGAAFVYFQAEGPGRIVLAEGPEGDLTVRCEAEEGHVFTGWTDEDGAPADFSAVPKSGRTYYARISE